MCVGSARWWHQCLLGSSIAHQGRSVSLAPTNRVLVVVPTRGKQLSHQWQAVGGVHTPESNAKTAPYAKLWVLATSILRLPISRPLYRQTNMSGKKGLVLKSKAPLIPLSWYLISIKLSKWWRQRGGWILALGEKLGMRRKVFEDAFKPSFWDTKKRATSVAKTETTLLN